MPITISGSTGIAGVDGSAGVPAVQGATSNNGVLFPAANTVALATAGTERMRVDSSGNMGIGTSSPSTGIANRVLAINGTDAGINFLVSGTDTSRIYSSSGEFRLQTATAIPLVFYTNNAERARITSTGDFQFNSGYGSVATAYGCRAWVNFNGQGVISIRASGNVSSITDTNTGEYGVNFATSMVDANYSAVVAHSHWGGITRLCDVNADGYTVNQFSMIIVGQQTTSWAVFDPGFVCVSIFR